jgi:triacylglycerol lipase
MNQSKDPASVIEPRAINGSSVHPDKNRLTLLRMNIVLMHGVLGFGRDILGVNYFNEVAKRLGSFPNPNVLTTEVDTIGTVEDRAAQAAHQIASYAKFQADKPIHIIAHSMGGLDARWLISHDLEGLQRRIRTLICLGTPHLGSPIASIINHVNPFTVLPFARVDTSFLNELRAKTNAVNSLSQGAAAQFNAACPDIASVHYFDVAGIGRDALFPTSVPFAPLYATVLATDGRNDGVVPFTSATRKRAPAAVWPADHADMVGHDLNGPPLHKPAFDYLSAYDSLVTNFILRNQ